MQFMYIVYGNRQQACSFNGLLSSSLGKVGTSVISSQTQCLVQNYVKFAVCIGTRQFVGIRNYIAFGLIIHYSCRFTCICSQPLQHNRINCYRTTTANTFVITLPIHIIIILVCVLVRCIITSKRTFVHMAHRVRQQVTLYILHGTYYVPYLLYLWYVPLAIENMFVLYKKQHSKAVAQIIMTKTHT